MKITFEQIGTIYTPFKTKEGMPIQAKGAEGVIGKTIKVKRTDNKIFKAVVINSKQVKIIE